MRNLPIDADKIEFISTGKVIAKPLYVELSDGTRRRDPNRQATTDDGVPLWTVDCIDTGDDDDNRRAETIGVTVASTEKPQVAKFQPVRFEGLVANVWLPKGSRFPEFTFRASGVASGAMTSGGASAGAKSTKSAASAEAA